MIRRPLDPFRAVPLLDLEERAESLTCSGDALYIGTAGGSLVHVDLAGWSASSAPEELAASARRKGSVKLSPKRPVEQVCAAKGVVLALADGVLSVLPSDLQSSSPTVLGKDVRCLCVHTGPEEDRHSALEVCVSFKKKLALYAYNGRTFDHSQDIPTAEAASALAWHQSWICAGFRKEYNLYSDQVGVPREICGLDGKVVPRIALVGDGELLLLIQENVGLFFNLNTQQPSSKSTVTWPRKVSALACAGGYVIGSTGTGQVDVYSVRDQKNCQTLTLEGPAVALCSAMGGRCLVLVEASLACLDTVPFDRQVKKLLLQARVSDALDLLNATFGPEDPQREEQMGRLHTLAGWALFRELQFREAFQYFTYSSDFKLARVLVFWRRYLPASWSPSPAGGRPPVDDGSPEPCDIEEFIRSRLLEKQTGQDKAAEQSSAVSANVGLANAAFVSFLLRQREALQLEERLPADQRPAGNPDPGQMLKAIDAGLLRLLLEMDEDDMRLQQLLDAGVRCAVEDVEAFLRERQRLDVLARLWKAKRMFTLVLQEWEALLNAGAGKAARLPASRIVLEMAHALQSAAATPEGAELLRRYVPKIMAVDPSAALSALTGGARPGLPASTSLPADEALQLLDGRTELIRGYLEHLVLGNAQAEPKYCGQLASIYIGQVGEEQARGEHGFATSPLRLKLLRFLEGVAHLDALVIWPRLEELELHEEKVVVCSREQRHHEALRVLVVHLNDLARAEMYCRIAMVRRCAPYPRSEEPSVFADSPPGWARSIVFGARKAQPAGTVAEDGSREEEAASTGSFGFGTVPSSASSALPAGAAHQQPAPQPLMLFLQVLLDASLGAEQKPTGYKKLAAEYKEAALSLLMGYAGHADLPPHEVVALLPAAWPLESVAAYLTKCARICLHERRASMLEENLSSMAYLKTFGAWATERMRKVTITSDRCCPKCTRRFVDKDSVGKAFVAYPNETCVHLQCKADASVCPKTGQSFADNLSVYCSALSADPTD